MLAELRDSGKETPRTRPETDQIYGMIEQLCPPGPKARLFAAPREGWEAPVVDPNAAATGRP